MKRCGRPKPEATAKSPEATAISADEIYSLLGKWIALEAPQMAKIMGNAPCILAGKVGMTTRPDGSAPPAGSFFAACMRCGGTVLLAPASREPFEMVKGAVICRDCFCRAMAEEKPGDGE